MNPIVVEMKLRGMEQTIQVAVEDYIKEVEETMLRSIKEAINAFDFEKETKKIAEKVVPEALDRAMESIMRNAVIEAIESRQEILTKKIKETIEANYKE